MLIDCNPIYIYIQKCQKCGYYSESHSQNSMRPELSNPFTYLMFILILTLSLNLLLIYLFIIYLISFIMVWVIINTLTYIYMGCYI